MLRKVSLTSMSKSFRKSLEEQLRDPEFKEAWDVLEPEIKATTDKYDEQHQKKEPPKDT